MLDGNPFADLDDDPNKLHVTFLDRIPDPERVGRLEAEAEQFRPDRLTVVGPDVYLHCPGGYGETTLNNVVPRAAARGDGDHPQLAHGRGPRRAGRLGGAATGRQEPGDVRPWPGQGTVGAEVAGAIAGPGPW